MQSGDVPGVALDLGNNTYQLGTAGAGVVAGIHENTHTSSGGGAAR